jgi:hypothetical protein
MTVARLTLVAVLLLTGSPSARAADTTARSGEQGAFLGVLFGPVPEVQFVYSCQRFARPFLGCLAGPADLLADKLPPLPGAHGVLVTQVMADSPAAKAGLKRGDVLLGYNDAAIRDCRHFVALIQADKPESRVNLRYTRDGREAAVAATLALGPVLRLAPAYSAYKKDSKDNGPRAVSKPMSPSSVSVAVGPLRDGKMKVIIEYYERDTGKLHTVTCQGSDDEIDTEVSRLPERERGLVREALKRLRGSRQEKPRQR